MIFLLLALLCQGLYAADLLRGGAAAEHRAPSTSPPQEPCARPRSCGANSSPHKSEESEDTTDEGSPSPPGGPVLSSPAFSWTGAVDSPPSHTVEPPGGRAPRWSSESEDEQEEVSPSFIVKPRGRAWASSDSEGDEDQESPWSRNLVEEPPVADVEDASQRAPGHVLAQRYLGALTQLENNRWGAVKANVAEKLEQMAFGARLGVPGNVPRFKVAVSPALGTGSSVVLGLRMDRLEVSRDRRLGGSSPSPEHVKAPDLKSGALVWVMPVSAVRTVLRGREEENSTSIFAPDFSHAALQNKDVFLAKVVSVDRAGEERRYRLESETRMASGEKAEDQRSTLAQALHQRFASYRDQRIVDRRSYQEDELLNSLVVVEAPGFDEHVTALLDIGESVRAVQEAVAQQPGATRAAEVASAAPKPKRNTLRYAGIKQWMAEVNAFLSPSDVDAAFQLFRQANAIDRTIGKLFVGSAALTKQHASLRKAVSGGKHNKTQRLAVDSSLANPVTLLRGPPGTGKTATLAQIVVQLVLKASQDAHDVRGKLLLPERVYGMSTEDKLSFAADSAADPSMLSAAPPSEAEVERRFWNDLTENEKNLVLGEQWRERVEKYDYFHERARQVSDAEGQKDAFKTAKRCFREGVRKSLVAFRKAGGTNASGVSPSTNVGPSTLVLAESNCAVDTLTEKIQENISEPRPWSRNQLSWENEVRKWQTELQEAPPVADSVPATLEDFPPLVGAGGPRPAPTSGGKSEGRGPSSEKQRPPLPPATFFDQNTLPLRLVRMGAVRSGPATAPVRALEVGALTKKLLRIRRAWKEAICGEMRVVVDEMERSGGEERPEQYTLVFGGGGVGSSSEDEELQNLCREFQWKFSVLELDALFYGVNHLKDDEAQQREFRSEKGVVDLLPSLFRPWTHFGKAKDRNNKLFTMLKEKGIVSVSSRGDFRSVNFPPRVLEAYVVAGVDIEPTQEKLYTEYILRKAQFPVSTNAFDKARLNAPCKGGIWPECLFAGETSKRLSDVKFGLQQQLLMRAELVVSTFGSVPKRKYEYTRGGSARLQEDGPRGEMTVVVDAPPPTATANTDVALLDDTADDPEFAVANPLRIFEFHRFRHVLIDEASQMTRAHFEKGLNLLDTEVQVSKFGANREKMSKHLWYQLSRGRMDDEDEELLESEARESLVEKMARFNSLSRLVLSGDHQQLGPVEVDLSAGAEKAVVWVEGREINLHTSIFAEIMEQYKNVGCTTMLDTTYRLLPEMAEWPSEVFYEGRLMAAERADRKSLTLLAPDDTGRDLYIRDSPLLFIPTRHPRPPRTGGAVTRNQTIWKHIPEWLHRDLTAEELNGVVRRNARSRGQPRGWAGPSASSTSIDRFFEQQDGTTKYNELEISIILELVEHLFPSTPAEEIGVIAYYKGQEKRLQRALAERFGRLTGLEVSSVEGFQGREKSVMIISTVASRKPSQKPLSHLVKKAGSECGEEEEKMLSDFVKDPRRLNVALTRAKEQVIVVGDPVTLAAGGEGVGGNCNWWARWLQARGAGAAVELARDGPSGEEKEGQAAGDGRSDGDKLHGVNPARQCILPIVGRDLLNLDQQSEEYIAELGCFDRMVMEWMEWQTGLRREEIKEKKAIAAAAEEERCAQPQAAAARHQQQCWASTHLSAQQHFAHVQMSNMMSGVFMVPAGATPIMQGGMIVQQGGMVMCAPPGAAPGGIGGFMAVAPNSMFVCAPNAAPMVLGNMNVF